MKTISNIKYETLPQSGATLVYTKIPTEGQTFEFISQYEIDKRSYTLSKRNGAGTYIVPVEKQSVYLNFIPKKTVINDQRIKKYLDVDFNYFVPAAPIVPELFTLPEGQIFRCVSETSVPLPKEQYQYYIIVGGKKRKIPNYKTLEVMLAERNQTLLSVRIVPERDCQQIPLDNSQIPDKQSAWVDDYKDQTTPEVLKQMEGAVKSGAAIAEAAAASAGQQIAAVKAQAEQAKSEADAAKAQSEADKAASEAAIANAAAAQAQAEAAKAEAELAKAQAENG